jgi:DUF1009 family protein
MHSAQKSQLDKVGIIAGSGRPPELLAQTLERDSIKPYIVALEGIAEPSLYKSREHVVMPIGMAGAILDWFKKNGVTEIVMTGALKRPEWRNLKVDPRGMKIIAKVALKSLGDDGLLRAIRKEIEADGFHLRGIHEFVPDLLMPAGLLTRAQPASEDWETIKLGWNASQELGRQDKGQSVIAQNDTVLALEGKDGTNALMEKAAQSSQSIGRPPILVKTCKPQQDRAIDMPSLGLKTIDLAARLGFCGIVLQAHESLLIDREAVIQACNEKGIFLYGLTPDDPLMIAA